MGAAANPLPNTPLPGSRACPINVDQGLPEACDVVVVGGGIAGICTAYYLAKAGVSVLVCEKGQVAAEQSSRAFGWVSNLGLDPIKMELTRLTKQLWKGLADQLGHDRLGYRQSGLMHLCRSTSDVEAEQGWLDAVREFDLDARLLSSRELAERVPGTSARFAGALFQGSDGRVEPQLATSVLAQAARQLGVKILAPCAVRGIERSAGAVSAVITEHGRVRCSQVVVAGGAWSRLFCGNAGLYLPQLSVHSSLVRIAPLAGGPTANTFCPGYAFRQDAYGGYVFGPTSGHRAQLTRDSFELFFRFLPALRNQWQAMKLDFGRAFFHDLKRPRRWALDQVSPFEHERMLNPAPDLALNLRTLANMAADFPAFRAARVVEHWAGMIDATPDSVPVISAVESIPGLYLNTGYSAYGLTMGPAGGRLLSELMTGRQPSVDPRAYRYTRFIDGSKLRVAP
ncbi:NAD(P)/FAD-dependent oxidoreductase [Pseudomonas citronellolis]|uniref:NAD(P)/FAD-dependent oxidoreductase n=1 Tax=Pseudomonas citronellolis TaxID=53408 RepID=UPI00209D8597|nr:FAD-binding oxidoreductase [Pseudomonas citronellolis]MCP1606008.1 glycine/D-amino acid oxidase-like deaminating enzyme [Pseudomonas citronellolis]MCP1656582.1 glycine/D-amino acid oxidase-like deaminating enzyme [Pseudomonas citronellolis]MCP1723611.1 glycine/D-amino acid oxidase-like deaminating enzyme [Pseudomonas citronellolis]WAB92977.1 FAD-binding oxidoreductase [Pseudomonas citronellolis]